MKRPRDLELDDEEPDSEFAITFRAEGDWFVGEVDLVKKDGRVCVYFQADDSDALIIPDVTNIEKFNLEQLEGPLDMEEGGAMNESASDSSDEELTFVQLKSKRQAKQGP